MEVLLVVVLGGRVTAALLGEYVDHDRALGREFDRVAEGVLECLDVVAVDGAHVADAEGFEKGRRLEELAHGGFEGLDTLLGLGADVGEVAEELLEPALAAHVDGVEADVGEAVGELLGDPLG